ncbi:MFS transporter [Ectothiorhodospiraceae bacterium WFHF3C12]|nr:MFS transporter [Ectothiorhodospiraceae bacterium WFHF3C12]
MNSVSPTSTATLSHGSGSRFEWIRWRLYAVLAASFFLGFFYRMAPGVVADELMRAFQTSGAALGLMVAMYFYIYTLMQVPAGVLADTLGPRTSTSLGALLAGGGSILFGLAPTFEFAAAGRFLMGLGTSTIFVGLLKINTTWFRDRSQGAANGLAMLLGNLGSVLAASPFAAMLAVMTWRTAFTAAGVLSVILGALTWLFVRDRPEQVGYRLEEDLPPSETPPVHWTRNLLAVVRTPPVWAGLGAQFGIGGTFFTFAGLWGVPLMQQGYGLGRTHAALYPTFAVIGLAVGALFFGWLSDRVGRRKPFIVGGALMTCLLWTYFILGPWSPGWSGLTLCFLIGFLGAATSVAYTAAKETVMPHQAGMAMAMVNTGLFLGVAIAQPALGWVLDLSWSGAAVDGVRQYGLEAYRQALWLSVLLGGISLGAALFSRETRCRNLALLDKADH